MDSLAPPTSLGLNNRMTHMTEEPTTQSQSFSDVAIKACWKALEYDKASDEMLLMIEDGKEDSPECKAKENEVDELYDHLMELASLAIALAEKHPQRN